MRLDGMKRHIKIRWRDWTFPVTRILSIKIKPPVKLYLADLIEDKDNPNIMSEEQEAALTKSMLKFGFLEPVIVGKKSKGKHTVYNGNHRLRQLLDAGNKFCYGYVVNKSESDLKLLRQITNKLHGMHDPDLDKLELDLIAENTPKSEIALYLADPDLAVTE